jgi:hypothetical protein
MGQKSLQLFILNGFVAVFLSPLIATLPWPHLTALHYAVLFCGIIGAHLLAMVVFMPLLDRIDQAAASIAAYLTQLLTGALPVRPSVR